MRTRVAYAALALVGLGLVTATVFTLRSDGSGSGGGVPVAGDLGPTPGPDSLGHIEAAHAYLDRLADTDPSAPASALISSRRMLTGAEAQGAAIGLEVSAVFVVFGDADPEAIPVESSIPVALAQRASELRSILEDEIEALEAGEGNEELLAELRSDLEETTPECSCVYAMVVEHTTVRRLVEARSHPEIRLVDVPEPLTDELGGWELTPILPPGEGTDEDTSGTS